MNIKPYLLGLGLITLAGCAPTRSAYYEYPIEHPVILSNERCSDCHRRVFFDNNYHHYGTPRNHDNRGYQPGQKPETRRYQPIDKPHRQRETRTKTDRPDTK